MEPTSIKTILKHYGIAGVHPAAEFLPRATDEEIEVMRADISAQGIIEPLKVDGDNLLVDGRNRLRVAWELKLKFVPLKRISPKDVFAYVFSENVARRHLTIGQRAMLGAQMANLPPGRHTADAAASIVSAVSAAKLLDIDRSGIVKARFINTWAKPEALSVKAGAMELNTAYRIACSNKAHSEQVHKPENPPPNSAVIKLPGIIDKKLVEVPYPAPRGKHTFNRTNDAVDWASWTWNPVTGCLHGCAYCYAREMAYRDSYKASYPIQFAPLFHHERLNDPVNTIPGGDRPQDGRVFVCSMADLFGEWVPQHWIDSVFEATLEAPEWEYLFLTKFPQRYRRINLPPKAWFGASVDMQKRVKVTEKFMANLDVSVRWISVEPMLEPLVFNDLSWCDLIVIGAQSETFQPHGHEPAFAPKLDWVINLISQARAWKVPVYLKPNLLGELTGSKPGMVLPQEQPRRR